jgi:hypothetical protein
MKTMSKASDVERLMLDLINKARANVGVAPVQLALDLNESAENHSDWMLAADQFSHTGARGTSAGDRMVDAGFRFSGSWSWGENIAWQSERGSSGIADDVQNLFASLMNSPGHRANILSAQFDYVGIGVERGNFNGWDAVIVTQNFASTGAPVALDTGPNPAPATAANTAPTIEMTDITVARVSGKKKKAAVEDSLSVTDADGDSIVFYEVRDTAGRHNFRIKGEGWINARDGYVIQVDDLENLFVRRDKHIGESDLQIRASDGEDWSDWAAFTLNTVSLQDFLM